LQAETFGGIVRVAPSRILQLLEKSVLLWVPINKLSGHIW